MNEDLIGIIITDYYDYLTQRAIDSLLRVSDEVIIIENNVKLGSYSSLKENKKVTRYVHNVKLDYAELRNIALSYARSKWVIFLDSDEELSEELSKRLRDLLRNNAFDGFWFSRKTYISKTKFLKNGLFYPDYQLRLLFAKPEYYFSSSVHEKINIPYSKTKEINLDILHFARNPKYTKFSDFKNFYTYIQTESEEYAKKNENILLLISTGIYKGISLFFSGFFRGKGFLDGWAGFRAHVLFCSYISAIYLVAAYKKIKKV